MESEIGYCNCWHDIVCDDLRNHVWECVFMPKNFYNRTTVLKKFEKIKNIREIYFKWFKGRKGVKFFVRKK